MWTDKMGNSVGVFHALVLYFLNSPERESFFCIIFMEV